MKRMLSLALALVLCLSLLPASPAWASNIDLGVETYVYIDDAVLVVQQCSEDSVTILQCKGYSQGDLTIPETIEGYKVANVPASVFDGCSSITSLTLPDCATIIGEGMCKECSSLKRIAVSDTHPLYSTDEQGALYNKDKTTLIKVPPALYGVFTIPEGVTRIADGAFETCKEITDVTIPDSVTEIGAYAFAYCTGLTDLPVFNNVNVISDYMFLGCDGLTEVTIPDHIVEIGQEAFNGCDNLTAVTFPGSVNKIKGHAFINCSKLPRLIVPDTVTSLGWRVCSTGVTVLETHPLYSSDAQGVLYKKDKTVLCWAPVELSGSYTVPSSVTELQDLAFSDCTGLETIYFAGNAPSFEVSTDWCGPAQFNNITATVYYPADDATWTEEVRQNYEGKITWEPYSLEQVPDCLTYEITDCQVTITGCDTAATGELVIPDTIEGYPVTGIGNKAFYNCTGLTGVTIPDSVTAIGEQAFYYCKSLPSVTIPNGVTSIEEQAFYCCTGLTGVTIPDSITGIGTQAFAYCSGLTSVTIPDSVTSIGEQAFAYCTGLTSVTVPDSVTSIGAGAFYYCKSLPSITIPGGVTTIGEQAFYCCTGLTSVTIPDSVTSIGDYAFYYCTSLPGITIPGGVTTIGEQAFAYCESLTSVTIPDSVTSIGSCVFYTCTSLTSVTIPDSVTSIGDYAFAHCESLTNITIPDSVTSIWNYAFYHCTGLNKITFTGNAPQFEDHAFNGVTATAYYPAGDATWTEEVRQNYEGTITWASYEPVPDCLTYEITDGQVTITGCDQEASGHLVIPSTIEGYPVTGIGKHAFDHAHFTSVTIPDSVTYIGNGAFRGSFVNSVYLGSGVTDIGSFAFAYCLDLRSIYFSGDAPSLWSDIFTGYDMQVHAFYPAGNPTWTEDLLWDYGAVEENNYYTPNSYVRWFPVISDEQGVLFNENKTTLYWAPRNISGAYTIPDSVTTIERDAFRFCYELTDINIANSVINIREFAFNGCHGLTEVTIPDSVTNIEQYAFASCEKLAHVTMSANVRTIEESAFASCSNLTDFTIPEGVTRIGSYAFGWCTKLTNVTIPDTVTSIGLQAFYECNSLAGVTIPSSVTYIGRAAFSYCTSLRDIRFNCSACKVEQSIFYQVTATAYYPGNDPSWTEAMMNKYGGTITWVPYAPAPDCLTYRIADGQVTITGCDNAVTGGMIIPDVIEGYPVTAIGAYAFQGCANLTHLIIADSVLSIGDSAFEGCSGLTDVTISDSVTVIGNSAFSNCTGLTSITIPNGITNIGDGLFSNCENLKRISFTGRAPQFGDAVFSGVTAAVGYPAVDATWTEEVRQNYGGTISWVPYEPAPSCLIYKIADGQTTITGCDNDATGELIIPDIIEGYPVTVIDSRAFANCTGLTSVMIPGSVTRIRDSAFSYCTGLTSVTIPDSVTTIVYDVFKGCTSLTSVAIPDSVTSIGMDAFYNCASLTSITIPDSVTSISSGAFEGCTSLTSVTLPDSITKIDFYVFQDCSSLTSVTIPNGVSSIGSCAFLRCTSLTSVTIPGSVTKIYGSAFSYCTSLTSITIPDSVTIIGDAAFSGCTGLTSVTIPDSVTTIESSVFSGCTGLTNVTIPDSITNIGDYMFSHCTSLTDIAIPDSVTIIGRSAFGSCENLTSVTIPNSVITIESYAFSECTSLTSITIPDSVITIESYAFEDCDSLTSVTIPDSVTSIGSNTFRYCSGLQEIKFIGSAPQIESSIFYCVTATAYYPGNDATWTDEVRQTCGGTITWVPWYSVQPELKPEYPNVSFEDEVVMKVYFSAQNTQDVVQMGLITYDQEVTQWNVDNAQHVIPGYTWNEDAQLYYAQTQGIPAAQMNKPMYFAVYAQLTDGSYAYSRLVSYCPADYAYNLLEDETMGSMAVSLLNYGAAAQAYFGTDGDGLMNGGLTEEQLALAENYRSDMVAPVTKVSETQQGSFVSTGGFTNRYPTVSFEGVFSIDYFAIPAAAPVDGMTMYVWDQKTVNSGAQLTAENAVDALAMTNDGTGTWQASVGDIAACQLDEGVYVAFCYSDGATEYCSGVLGYSIGNYCASQANGDTTLATLAKATAVYGYYAKQLFA